MAALSAGQAAAQLPGCAVLALEQANSNRSLRYSFRTGDPGPARHSGIPLELIALLTPLPADGGPVPGEIIEHQAHPSATPRSFSRIAASARRRHALRCPDPSPRRSPARSGGRYETALDRLEEAARHVDVVVLGHGAVAESPEVAVRLAADRAYIDDAGRRGTGRRASGAGCGLLSGPHQSNLEQARGR
jgi:hypothetical protein